MPWCFHTHSPSNLGSHTDCIQGPLWTNTQDYGILSDTKWLSTLETPSHKLLGVVPPPMLGSQLHWLRSHSQQGPEEPPGFQSLSPPAPQRELWVQAHHPLAAAVQFRFSSNVSLDKQPLVARHWPRTRWRCLIPRETDLLVLQSFTGPAGFPGPSLPSSKPSPPPPHLAILHRQGADGVKAVAIGEKCL